MTTWTPDTDNCKIEISDGRYSVRDGDRPIREFDDLAAAQAFADKGGYRVVDTGFARGALIGWKQDERGERSSKVHATPADVLAENQRKNFALADVEKEYPDKELTWAIDPNDRAVVIGFVDKGEPLPTRGEKDTLQTTLESKFGSGKVRVE